MTLYVLGYAPRGHEFTVESAVSATGATAIVPRRVDMVRLPKQRRPQQVESPVLANYVFAAMTAAQWHEARKPIPCGKHIITPLTTVAFIAAKEWHRNIQPFADAVAADYRTRIAQIEAGNRVQEYQPGDRLEILGGLLAGQFANFRRLIEGTIPMIEAEAEISILGKRAIATVDPILARRVA